MRDHIFVGLRVSDVLTNRKMADMPGMQNNVQLILCSHTHFARSHVCLLLIDNGGIFSYDG